MIGLKFGNYLGETEILLNADGIIASITSYPNTSYSESLQAQMDAKDSAASLSHQLTFGNVKDGTGLSACCTTHIMLIKIIVFRCLHKYLKVCKGKNNTRKNYSSAFN
jgi:hypothetical protein